MKRLLTAIVLVTLLISCSEEDLEHNVELNDTSLLAEVRDGRLKFTSRDELQRRVNEFKETEGELAMIELPGLTEKGFYSLRPVIAEQNVELVSIYNERLRNAQGETEYLEQLVADDAYAFFLNDKGEIHVGDSIYKYTESGLYFVHLDDVDYLNTFLRSSAPKLRAAPCPDFIASSLSRIDSRITHFAANCDPGLPNPPIGPTYPPRANPLPAFIASLPVCNPRDGVLKNFFGTSRICEEYFTNRHKVKTKFWNQDYLLLRSIGISVKNQKRQLGFVWINERPTEIGYGIYEAQFKYGIPVPNYSTLEAVYIHNGKVIDKTGKVTGSSPPLWPFKSPIEIYVPLPLVNWPSTKPYTPKELNKYFWDKAWKKAKSVVKGLKDEDKKKVTFIGFLPDKIHVMYSDVSNSKRNRAVIKNVFDWNFEIGYKGSLNHPTLRFTNVSVKKLYSYSDATIDFYGYVLSGGRYKGSRLQYTD